MRKLILSLLFVLCLSFQASAWNPMVMGSGVGSPVCSTANDEALYVPTGQDGDSPNADAVYVANKLTFAAQKTVTMYQFKSCDNSGSDTGSQTLCLYDDDGGGATSEPTTIVANSSINKAASTLGDCATQNQDDYELASSLVVSAGTYWVVAIEVDSADILKEFDSSSGSGSERKCYSADGTNWTCDDNKEYNMEVWGCN